MTKYGRPAHRRPGVEHTGDVGMVHHRQRLPLALEASNDLPAVHPRLDNLDRDFALNRLGLLGHEHGAHAALTDLLQKFVRPDHVAGALAERLVERLADIRRGLVQEVARLGVSLEQHLHALAQGHVFGTCLIQICRAVRGRRSPQRFRKIEASSIFHSAIRGGYAGLHETVRRSARQDTTEIRKNQKVLYSSASPAT